MRILLLSAATLIMSVSLMAQAGPRGRRGDGDGQNRPDRGPRIEELTDFLGLTEEQVESLGGVLQNRAQALRENMQMIREKQQAAREEIASDNPDPLRIGQLLLEAKNMQGAVRARNDEFVAAAQDVLDDIQKAKLSSLERMIEFQPEIRQAQALGLLPNQMGDFRLGGGPGGVGRPGPGGRGGPGGPGGPGGRRGGGRPGGPGPNANNQ